MRGERRNSRRLEFISFLNRHMSDVVNVKNFLLSIRETGYRSFAHTIAELVDNSLQAGATRVSISIGPKETGQISVTDNGSGMPHGALRTALQFGGSTRFGDRSGAGRFGMGLPTSSITLAKRVDVFTWKAGTIFHVNTSTLFASVME